MKVLYVDDEPDIREIVCIALELDSSIEAKSVASGREALDIVTTYQPDIILLDVMMPEMDGPATLRGFRSIPQTSATPVVFTTAKVQRSEVERLLTLGAIEVIAKPFDPLTLADVVKDIWERHHD